MSFNFNQHSNKPVGTNQNSMMNMFDGYNNDLLSLLSNPSVNNILDLGQTTSMVDDTNRLLFSLLNGTNSTNSSSGYEIYVTYLPPATTEIELMVLFQEYGELTNCTIASNKYQQKFAYISYVNEADARAAIEKMNRFKIGVHTIQVKWSNRNVKRPQITSDTSKQTDQTKSKEKGKDEISKLSNEYPSKRKKSDPEIAALNPLFQSPPKEASFQNKMSEGLLKISEFQCEADKSDEKVNKCAKEDTPKTKRAPTTPKANDASTISSDVEVEEVDNSTPTIDLRSEQLQKELEELKSKVIRLESEKNDENQLKEAELKSLRAQVEAENKKNEELKKKIEELKNQPVSKTPTMEDFESLKVKVERLEQENQVIANRNDEKANIAKVEPNDGKTADDKGKDNSNKEPTEAEPKSKDDNNLSDIDVCILNLSQTINEHFKSLAGKLMSGQKEKEEELMMERLRSLEPIQAVVYEKLQWILSIGGNPNSEGALRSASKVSKHFPFLLSFLGFNYHDLIMMSVGMEKDISQVEAATRLSKWFNYVLKEKGHLNKRIWPSLLSTNMLASILTEHFLASSKQKSNLKPMISNHNKPAINPLVMPNQDRMTKQAPKSRKDNDVRIVGEFSQASNNASNAAKAAKGCSMLSNIGAMHNPPPFPPPPFPSMVDMRTVGSNKKEENQGTGISNNYRRLMNNQFYRN